MGPWEVTGGIKAIDLVRGVCVRTSVDLNMFLVILTEICYRCFKATNASSVGHNIFSLPLTLDSNLKFIDWL